MRVCNVEKKKIALAYIEKSVVGVDVAVLEEFGEHPFVLFARKVHAVHLELAVLFDGEQLVPVETLVFAVGVQRDLVQLVERGQYEQVFDDLVVVGAFPVVQAGRFGQPRDRLRNYERHIFPAVQDFGRHLKKTIKNCLTASNFTQKISNIF